MASAPVLLLVLLIVPIIVRLLLRKKKCLEKKMKKNLLQPPSPPGALPVIGHLHLIGDRPHASLRDLAAKNGDMMLLRLGSVWNLVVSSPKAAQAILRTHDHVFASRPASMVSDALLYGSSDVGFAPYGEHWRQVRKLVTTHLFTVKKVRSFRQARQQETRLVMAKIQQQQEQEGVVDMSELLNSFANDMVCRAVSGKFFRAEGRNRLFRELIEMNSRLFGGFSLLDDHFPALARSVPVVNWLVRRKAREAHRRWDQLLENIITDHQSSRRRSFAAGLPPPPSDDAGRHRQRHTQQEEDLEESDFIDLLLSVQQEYGITRDHIKAILMDMFGAGTDTSSLVLELAVAELMRHPHVMTKLQAEVRSNTPPAPEGQDNSMVMEDDLDKMPFLKAVVKETLRLHPPAPLLIPHLAMADCEIPHLGDDEGGCNYTVQAGTRVIVNAWAINRDPESWKEKPEEFVPDRFMEGGSAAGVDFRGNDFQFLPFGAGRRVCPGLNFGLATVEIMLANLIYRFDWELPDGVDKDDIDMTEVFGLTVRRKEKLVLVPKPIAHAT